MASPPKPPGKLPPRKAPPGTPNSTATRPHATAPSAPPTQQHPSPQPSRRTATPPPIDGLSPPLSLFMEAVAIYDALLIEENALLEQRDAHAVAAMLDRKIAATQLYQDRLRAVLADPASTRALDPGPREQVIHLVKAMEEKARQNALLLEASMQAVEKVIDAVNMAARQARRQEVGYSEKGEIKEAYGASGPSMTLNSNI